MARSAGDRQKIREIESSSFQEFVFFQVGVVGFEISFTGCYILPSKIQIKCLSCYLTKNRWFGCYQNKTQQFYFHISKKMFVFIPMQSALNNNMEDFTAPSIDRLSKGSWHVCILTTFDNFTFPDWANLSVLEVNKLFFILFILCWTS